MATANLFDIDAEVGSEEDDDYDEETGQAVRKPKRTNGANLDDSSEEEDDDDEEAEREVSSAHTPTHTHTHAQDGRADVGMMHCRSAKASL